jgi:malonate decarboxylase delta subunit
MEHIVLEYPAAEPAQGRTLVGVVASGDLEVLIEGNTSARTTVTINTSIDGFGKVWEAALSRLLGAGDLPAVKLELNDFGATPGVVRMRVAQAFEELAQVAGGERK